MIDVQPIIKAIEAYVRRWIQEMGGTPGSGGYAPRPHDLSSDNHTGSISDAQGPQFLKTDGSRMLTGDQTVAAGVTFDGVDVSEHKLATDALTSAYNAHKAAAAAAGHDGGVGDHNHQTAGAQGGPLDHGAALTGLGDDDHTQYLLVNGARAMSGHLLPSLTDTYDLGSSTRLWRKGWLSELDTIIFAKNTITLLGGWLVVGPNEGSLAADVLAADTSIDFGMTMTVGDFVLFRGILQVEYMQVGALVSGTRYNVTRNLDGSGANNWPMGTPYAVNGQNGAGRIELNAYATPRMSILRQGATYNAQTELIRIGDLNAWGDYVAETYGAAFGDYAGAGANVTIDPTNGVRLRRGNVDVIKLTATDATFKSLIKMPDTTSALAIGATPPTSSSAGTGIWIDRTGLYSLNANARQVWISTADGALYAGNGEMKVDIYGLTLPTTIVIIGDEVNYPSSIKWQNSGYETASIKGTSVPTSKFSQIILDSYYYADPISGASSSIKLFVRSTPNTIANETKGTAYFHSGGLDLYGTSGSGSPTTSLDINQGIIKLGYTIANPLYVSSRTTIWTRNNTLYALSPDNIPANLSAGSSAAYLMPLMFYRLGALWKTGVDYVDGTGTFYGIDLGPGGLHLTRNGTAMASSTKGAPGQITGSVFNGTNNYLAVALNGAINAPTNFGFGTWIYLDAVNRSHGIVRCGSTTISWQILYYYAADNNRYFEFSYFEASGTQRIVGTIQHNAVGYVYVGASLRWAATGDNWQALFVNDQVAQVTNSGWGSPRAGAGEIQMGVAGPAATYWLLGKIYTAWYAGFTDTHHTQYYAATRGNFEY